MKHASLFSGIGGFDLASKWMGWENVFSCEFDPFCQSVLKHHFPTTTHYGDIRQLDGTKYRGTIDVLTGGFPCQPFSVAGQRRGTDDNRFLWPEMLRVIREIQPTWIVAENVRGIVSIDSGLVFERVCSEMEANGYEVQPFCIPACAVGAPHRRERMWFIARSNSSSKRWDDGGDNREGRCIPSDERTTEKGEQERQGWKCGIGKIGAIATDTNDKRLEGCGEGMEASAEIRTASTVSCERSDQSDWPKDWREIAFATCYDGVDDGLSERLHGITVPKWRKESLRAYGNAIVPQVAYKIFQSIQCATI